MEVVAIKRRKKVCCRCGRKLWLRDFYKSASGKLFCACKECCRKEKKEWYTLNRKKPDGVSFDQKEGRLMQHNGPTKRIYWTGDMISILRRHFPTTKNDEVAEMIGVSPSTVVRKARELGIEKDAAFLHTVWNENRLLAHVTNKVHGNSGMIKKGHIPWNKGLKIKEAI